MEMAIGCPRNIPWVYEIFVYKVPSTYLAHCRCSQNRSNNSERLSLPHSEVPCDPGFTLSLISKLLSEPGLVHPIADSISCSGNRSHHPSLPFMDFDKDNWEVHAAFWKSKILLDHSFVHTVKRKEGKEGRKGDRIQKWCFRICKVSEIGVWYFWISPFPAPFSSIKKGGGSILGFPHAERERQTDTHTPFPLSFKLCHQENCLLCFYANWPHCLSFLIYWNVFSNSCPAHLPSHQRSPTDKGVRKCKVVFKLRWETSW